MRNRSSLTGGLILILSGFLFLLNQVIPDSWPFLIIGAGGIFLIFGVILQNGGLMIPGTLTAGAGGILLYQSLTGDWASWFYLWPLVPASMGVGMILSRMLGVGGGRYLRVGLAWTLVGLAMTAFFWYFQTQLAWPAIIVGAGVTFILVAVLSGVMPQAIPGTIIGGTGIILAWQNATGNWDSWAYAWALIPGLVGLGLVISFLSHRVVRTVGMWLMGWSLVVFLLFGIFFAGDGAYLRFWPLILVIIGGLILLQSFTRSPRVAGG